MVQRFWGVDPLASRMPGWSTYSYAFNNPVFYIDPDGRMPFPPDFLWGHRLVNSLRGSWNNYRATANGLKSNYGNLTGQSPSFSQNVKMEVTAATLHFGGYTSQNDISVLSSGENMDGSQANGLDKALAVVFVGLPVSGSGVKNVFKQLISTEPAMQSVKKITSMVEDLKGAKSQEDFNKIFMGSDAGGGPAKILENPIDGKDYIIDGHHRLSAAEQANTGYSVPTQRVNLGDTTFDSFQDVIDASNNY